MTHDYTHKGGIVHTEIMLPAHAPPEFQDRSTLWNSVEQIEKSSDAQLAREIEVALPVELAPAEQLALVRAFVKDNFIAAGMCADFTIHDKGTGNPHAHIMLTIRPSGLMENGGRNAGRFTTWTVRATAFLMVRTVGKIIGRTPPIGMTEATPRSGGRRGLLTPMCAGDRWQTGVNRPPQLQAAGN